MYQKKGRLYFSLKTLVFEEKLLVLKFCLILTGLLIPDENKLDELKNKLNNLKLPETCADAKFEGGCKSNIPHIYSAERAKQICDANPDVCNAIEYNTNSRKHTLYKKGDEGTGSNRFLYTRK